MNIVQAMSDKKLFAPWFKEPSTWEAWRAFLACLFALPMDDEQRAIARACTGLEALPERPFTEAWLVVGRRGGKSLVLAMIAIYLALFKDWSANLVPGERGVVLVLAADRRQAQSIMRYATALCTEVPLLAGRVARATTEEIEFRGRVGIEVATDSYRTVRGRTLIAGLLDELAFFRSEDSANPDFEILDAIRPAMASMPGSMLLCASSPYSRRGALWEAYRKWFGVAGAPCLVWQAPTRTMNPTIKQDFVDAQYERDPASAMAEYGAQFRNDIDSYVTRDAIAGVTVQLQRELVGKGSALQWLASADVFPRVERGQDDAIGRTVSRMESNAWTIGTVRGGASFAIPTGANALAAAFEQLKRDANAQLPVELS